MSVSYTCLHGSVLYRVSFTVFLRNMSPSSFSAHYPLVIDKSPWSHLPTPPFCLCLLIVWHRRWQTSRLPLGTQLPVLRVHGCCVTQCGSYRMAYFPSRDVICYVYIEALLLGTKILLLDSWKAFHSVFYFLCIHRCLDLV